MEDEGAGRRAGRGVEEVHVDGREVVRKDYEASGVHCGGGKGEARQREAGQGGAEQGTAGPGRAE